MEDEWLARKGVVSSFLNLGNGTHRLLCVPHRQQVYRACRTNDLSLLTWQDAMEFETISAVTEPI